MMNAQINAIPTPLPVTGSAMDKVVKKNYKRLGIKITIGVLAACALLAMGWSYLPKGLSVPMADVRMQTVSQGVFLDDIIVRANAQPLTSVMLDSVESGRVEEVLIQDGALVKKGQLLFRLSNPQRNLDLLQRKGEHTQQISNLANMQVQFQMSETDHQRRLSALEFELSQVQKKHSRNVKLAEQGFISPVALEESLDTLDRAKFALKEAKLTQAQEAKVRGAALGQMETGINGLQSGLKLVSSTVEGLAVRAPIDGKLTDFKLQVGESVNTGKRIGRIDAPHYFKLAALVDEFYLNRVAAGIKGTARMDDKTVAVEVMSVFPQIKDGRFLVELKFIGEVPAKLNPGQSLDTTINLGDPSPALVLPMGEFMNDTGGTWVFVVSADGKTAERRNIQVGQRSNRQVEIRSGLKAGEKVVVSSYTAFATVKHLQFSNASK